LALSNGHGNGNGNGHGHINANTTVNGSNTGTAAVNSAINSSYGVHSQTQSQNGSVVNGTGPATQKEASPTTASSVDKGPTMTGAGAANRYPGLSSYLTASNTSLSPQQSQQQKLGALSPPKSTLGITGVSNPVSYV
jgi:hypothetical protein